MKSQFHIIIGLSGGVDSAVSAYLLAKAGHYVEAVFMKNWEGDDESQFCPAEIDIQDAQLICEQLNIPFHVVNFANEYWDRVFSHFLAEYRVGRTPNPDILCNKEIKFRAFLDFAKGRGADYIATGHYARTEIKDNNTLLLKGNDLFKDQTYFLHAVSSAELSHCFFPVGELKKMEVRKIASDLGFINHNKKDSTGICFIGERKFKQFLSEYLPTQKGIIETDTGEEIGEHDGLMFYTIGQRQGLHIGGQTNKFELPWYVAHKDLSRNVLIVVQGENHPALFKQTLIARNLHWVNNLETFPENLAAKTRYRQSDQFCEILSFTNDEIEVKFHTPQRALTEGQSVVFYDDEICLGGGIIDSAM